MEYRWVNWAILTLVFSFTIASTVIAINYARDASFHKGWLTQTLITPVIKVGNPLEFNIITHKQGEKCTAFTVRVITNNDSHQEAVWNQTIQLPDDEFTKDYNRVIAIHPNLKPGHYAYRADIHINCGDGQFITGTPLFPFEVQE